MKQIKHWLLSKRLQKFFNTDMAACSTQSVVSLEIEKTRVKIRVMGVNDRYTMFNSMGIVKGSFFREADDREGSRVVVIEEEMAWNLFNNDDVVGHTIHLFDKPFKIIGVVRHDTSVVNDLTRDGGVYAYMPVHTYLELNPDTGITYI